MTVLLAIGGICGALLAIAAVVGLMCRFILLPWLREQLVNPVRGIHHQVAVNGHKSDPPTLLDKVDSLSRRFDDHLAHAADMDAHLLAHIANDVAHPRRLRA